MLVARAPVRISFAGGGTDLEAYYREHGGLVISTTIDKHFYVFANLNGADSVQITSSDYRTFFRQRRGEPILWDGDLSLPRAFLHEFGIDGGISLFLASEIPPGTGLGSSSTVSVALAKALGTLTGLNLGKAEVAELASYVEIEKMGMPIGKQDQYAAAFGGLNAIYFRPDGVEVVPLRLAPAVSRQLERSILLFYTGASRSAASILKDQQAASRQEGGVAVESLHRIKELARTTIDLFKRGDLRAYGELMHEGWEAKKRLARGITNPRIDEAYALARARGALGGKIAGAGGGGFLMLFCEEPNQDAVTIALEAKGLVRMDFHFDSAGATVLIDSIPRLGRLGRPEQVRRKNPPRVAAGG